MFLINLIKWNLSKSKLANIKFLALDVDGVLTDGGLLLDNNGNLLKCFNVKDGLGIKILQNIGVEIILISGGLGGALESRAKQLGIKEYHFGVKNKLKLLIELKRKFNFSNSEIIYIGDDINDLPLKNHVSLLVGTKDASKFYKKYCDLITNQNGGHGAVRELAEKIIFAKNREEILSSKGWFDNN